MRTPPKRSKIPRKLDFLTLQRRRAVTIAHMFAMSHQATISSAILAIVFAATPCHALASAMSKGAAVPDHSKERNDEEPPSISSPSSPPIQLSASDSALTSKIVVDAERALKALGSARRFQPWANQLSYQARKWQHIFETARDCPDLRRFLFGLDAQAKETLEADSRFYLRPRKLGEIHPDLIDGRYRVAGDNGELFALSMADCGQANFVRCKGVPLAIMAVYTGNADYLRKSIQILTAMLDHAPLQRPGWTAYTPTSHVPPEGDGVWLATSWGLEGIIDMIEILGDRLPGELRANLDLLIRTEVSRIVTDWADSRPWYVKSHTVQSNQWMEPSIGLIKACLYLHDQRLVAAYDLGVENLGASLATLGQDGAFAEGISYASMTVGTVFQALGDLKANNDLRCHGFPYVNNAWKWFLHMQMPGGRYVNCYDSTMCVAPDWATQTPLPSLIDAAIGSNDPGAIRQTQAFFPVGDATIPGICYQHALCGVRSSDGVSVAQLPTWAHFPSQALVVWRSKWEPAAAPQTAMGVWVRGGSLTDSHSHRDQGHVSVYSGTRPILIEAGTPTYSDPEMETKYAAAAGHSIMQVGEAKPRIKPFAVPLSIETLDASGGRVSMDTAGIYEGVTHCRRTVDWKSTGVVAIDDSVLLVNPLPSGSEIYRFHTGSTEPIFVTGSGASWRITWQGVAMAVTADRDITVSQASWPDAVSLGQTRHHQAVIIASPIPTNSLLLRTVLTVDVAK
jgi:hypothetical protein